MKMKNVALDRLINIQNHISIQNQSKGTIDLERERENASFKVEHMNWLFWGGKELAEALVRKIQFSFSLDYVLNYSLFAYIIYIASCVYDNSTRFGSLLSRRTFF